MSDEEVMVDVIECPHYGCHYQTNIKGDLTRHRHDAHGD